MSSFRCLGPTLPDPGEPAGVPVCRVAVAGGRIMLSDDMQGAPEVYAFCDP
jgi:hypothetical protein